MAAAAAVRRRTRSYRSCSSRESSISHDACRSPSSREEAPYIREHAHTELIRVSTLAYSRSKNSTMIIGSSTAAAAADGPNSSSSSTQQRRRRGSVRGQRRASEPPFVHLFTPCLGSCAFLGSVTCALCLQTALCHVYSVLFVGCFLLQVRYVHR